MNFINDLSTFLQDNPGAMVIVALLVLWRTGKDVILPMVLPSVRSASQKSDTEGGVLKSLTDVITTQNTSIQETLDETKLHMATIAAQYQKTNEYFEKLVFASQQQLVQTEKWLGTIGEGFVGVLSQHEGHTSERFKDVEAFILQNTSELLGVKQELFGIKMAINMLALEVRAPPKGEDTEPMNTIIAHEEKPNV